MNNFIVHGKQEVVRQEQYSVEGFEKLLANLVAHNSIVY